jgi:hypothetical protein
MEMEVTQSSSLLNPSTSSSFSVQDEQVLVHLHILNIKSTLCLIYCLAQSGFYDEAKNIFLSSRVFDDVHRLDNTSASPFYNISLNPYTPSNISSVVSDLISSKLLSLVKIEEIVSTQILFNRTLIQLGVAAFKQGLFCESFLSLQEICSQQRGKELIGQFLGNYFRTSTQDGGAPFQSISSQEKARMVPVHMQIQYDFVESIYYTSALLLETPLIAHSGRTIEDIVSHNLTIQQSISSNHVGNFIFNSIFSNGMFNNNNMYNSLLYYNISGNLRNPNLAPSVNPFSIINNDFKIPNLYNPTQSQQTQLQQLLNLKRFLCLSRGYRGISLNNPPENLRDFIYSAALAMINGNWEEACNFVKKIPSWNLFQQSQLLNHGNLKESIIDIYDLITKLIKEETLHCFIIRSSHIFDSLSLSFICKWFEGNKEDKNTSISEENRNSFNSYHYVKSVITRMIASGEISASLDSKDEILLYSLSGSHGAHTPLQRVSLQVSEKLPNIILQVERQWDWNSKIKSFNSVEAGRGNYHIPKKYVSFSPVNSRSTVIPKSSKSDNSSSSNFSYSTNT